MKDYEFERLKDETKISYNGDLGVLQHVTKEKYKTLYLLERLGEIDGEQFDELAKLLTDNFTAQLKQAIEQPHYYIR